MMTTSGTKAMIKPSGIYATMTREALMKEREKDAALMRAKWKAEEEARAKIGSIIRRTKITP